MKILSEDKKRLNQLRELLDSHGEISTHGLAKSHFDQSVIDNTFVELNRRIKNITEEDSGEISGECPICYESMIIGNVSQLNCGILNKQGDGHWFHTA